jgi:hypothetical protein
MSDRKPVFIVLGIGALITILVVFALDKSPPREPAPSASATTSASALPDLGELPAVLKPHAIKRPSGAVVELAIFTDRPKAELDAVVDVKSAVALLKSQHCGDRTTCDAVKKFLLAENNVRIDVMTTKAWSTPADTDLPRIAPSLSDPDRAKWKKTTSVVHVLVSGPPQPDQLPARGGFALTGAIAEKLQGFVHDNVADRLERAPTFVLRAITAPLGGSAFRKDRIDYQFTTREGGNVRLITAGMLRFGAPDLEIFGADRAIAQKLADVLGALAEALANGAPTAPITIALADVERARGSKIEAPEVPPPMAIDLEDVAPEPGDPNDLMARVVPPEGPSPEGYEGLAASFFGSSDPENAAKDEMIAIRDKAQRMLPDVLARYTKLKADGAALFLEIPMPMDPDAGDDPFANPNAFDFVSLEVTSFDATTVTGTIYEEPSNPLGVHQGDTLTRKRSVVTDYVLRFPDGGLESASMPE